MSLFKDDVVWMPPNAQDRFGKTEVFKAEAGAALEDEIKILKDNYHKYDFFFVHIKLTDTAGEDGDFARKVKALEQIDAVKVTRHYVMVILPRLDAGEVCGGQSSYLYLPPEHVVVITD